MNSQLIKQFIEDLYPCQVGFVKPRIFTELKTNLTLSQSLNFNSKLVTEDIQMRINPFKIYNKVKTIIVIIFPYTSKDDNLQNQNHLVSRSSWGLDYHNVIKEKLDVVKDYLKSNYNKESKVLVDNHPLHEKHIAYLAGLGNFGKNSLLINEKYGSYFFISLLLTDLELNEDEYSKPNLFDVCKDCNRCIKACPTNAISEDRMINSKICMSYLTQSKIQFEDKYLSKFKKFSFGCDFCQVVCVYNSKVNTKVLSEFMPSGQEIVKVNDLYNLSNKEFKNKFKEKAFNFRGKNVMLRNSLLVSANNNNYEDLQNIDKIDDNNNEYLKQAIIYAKRKVNKGE